jgi:arylsulfatase A-like enzyme
MVPDPGAWSKLSPEMQKIEARKMEVYAAMVDRLDQNVGRLIAHLKSAKLYDNTIFVFMSDNGPAGEGAKTFAMIPGVVRYIAKADNSLDNIGSATSFVFYGPYWAQAGSAPFRQHKALMTEGGTRVAAFITYPGLQRQGEIGGAYSSVMDVLPTLIEESGGSISTEVNGRSVAAIRGRSMLAYLQKRSDRVHPENEAVSFELHGQRAVRQGDWKLMRLPTPFGDDKWALYNLADDPSERVDVGDRFPERRAEMIAAWASFAGETKIKAAP